MAAKTLSFSNIFLSNARATISNTRDRFSKFNCRERCFYKIFLCLIQRKSFCAIASQT